MTGLRFEPITGAMEDAAQLMSKKCRINRSDEKRIEAMGDVAQALLPLGLALCVKPFWKFHRYGDDVGILSKSMTASPIQLTSFRSAPSTTL